MAEGKIALVTGAGSGIGKSVAAALAPLEDAGHCATFPFGSSFTEEERALLPALALLKEKTATRAGLVSAILSALAAGGVQARHEPALARMGLEAPAGPRQRLYRRLLGWALNETD